MRILITAGSTMGMIDGVRGIGNIFKGGTGAKLARTFADNRHTVTLLTSNGGLLHDQNGIRVREYVTFADLAGLLEEEITMGEYDLIVHSAAINDFTPTGTFIPTNNGQLTQMSDVGKISSQHKTLFIRLSPTYKLIDKIRTEWGFKGVLVKFKLQVGMSDEELVRVATKSMQDSDADIIVANCKEWKDERAIVISKGHTRPLFIRPIRRSALAKCILRATQDVFVRKENLPALKLVS
ncbi:bifunctional phosphopantothenoylcysteine decarboxylase/phosphopantothenate synthase [Candidatus Uhrbacteria bacterium]|nr:bifunctional phosphopantothenoylcysteine decarboxylase/phosphopantothenate synthase [Candidatus Uhrbacteria bacterium]